MRKPLLLVVFLLFILAEFSVAQQRPAWTTIPRGFQVTKHKSVLRETFPTNFKLFQLDLPVIRETMMGIADRKGQKTTITIPNADGNLEQFEISEASNFEPTLQANFPQIRAFSGKSLSSPGSTLKISLDGESVQTIVFRTGDNTEYIEPYSQDKRVYAVFRKERSRGQSPWTCSTQDKALTEGLNNRVELMAAGSSDGFLRTMRLAQSCNAEYSNYFGAFSPNDVSKVLAAFNATLTRCNGVYEKDLALHLNLVPESVNVIYYNPSTDPYSTRLSSWNNQLQTTLTSVIGEANYDIGHMFGKSGGGGNAGCIGCVCSSGKGSGITSPADGVPQGDNFDIDYVAHEVGHQLGANHTFSMSNEGRGVNKEVGSGITVMGYAGITSQDVANHSIDIFHQASIEQIRNNLAAKACPVKFPTGISAPIVSVPGNFTIPKSTPFQLTGSATGNNPGSLTYCWEQNDNASSTQTGTSSVASATKATGPNWITFPASTSGTRYFPRLATILAGGTVTGPLNGGDAGANTEALSSVARTLNFRLTARDNEPYVTGSTVGQTGFNDVVITVDGTAGPFSVTAPNTAVTWNNGTAQTITWSVNGTNLSPINCANVRILLSTDGGTTFPTVLADNTPNDGSETVSINVSGTLPLNNCRIKVESVGNIFFDIGNTNFTIGNPPLCGTPSGLTASAIGNTTATLSWVAVSGTASYTASYKAASSVSWKDLTGLTTTSAVINGLTAGTLYDWKVAAVCSGGAGSPATAQFTTTGGTATCPNSLDNSTNGTTGGAAVIPFNTDVLGKLSPKGDIDYYKFSITTAGSVSLSLSTLPADYDLRLYNASGVVVASSTKTGTVAESITYSAAIGTYFAHVSGYRNANNSTLCYTLRVNNANGARVSDDLAGKIPAESEDFTVFPNPSSGLLTIGSAWATGSAEVSVLSTQGRNLLSTTVNQEKNTIDISGLPSGMYMLKIRDGASKLHVRKVFKN